MSSLWRSHGNVIIALGAGVAVGVSVTLVVQRLSHAFGRDLAQLIVQIESLKQDVEKLRSTLEKKRSPGGFYSVHASSGEEDDEFLEAYEGLTGSASENDEQLRDSSFTSEDYVSAKSSVSSVGPSRLFREVDSLLEGDDAAAEKAYTMLKDKENGLKQNPAYLWRLAKAAFSMSQIEGAKGNPDEKKRLIYYSRDVANEALEYDETDHNAHKWYAIALGSVGDYEGTQTKILNGYKFKEHIEKAIEIAPHDPSALHLMGRWCYGVYMLSWIERKAANALFAAPPTATVDEALNHFVKADELNPGKWKENCLFVAKCYVEKRDYYSAVDWLEKADKIHTISQDDRDSQKEIDSLLYKYSGYKR